MVLTTSPFAPSDLGLDTTNCSIRRDRDTGFPKYRVFLIIFTKCNDAADMVNTYLNYAFKTRWGLNPFPGDISEFFTLIDCCVKMMTDIIIPGG